MRQALHRTNKIRMCVNEKKRKGSSAVKRDKH
jgi:hypothetical protein